ncbi:MAG: hypothetical protein U9Q63_00070, partial [Patescibacteria group bacterium]|nr:hypothetical protein [Patescibacteria group bacterium]
MNILKKLQQGYEPSCRVRKRLVRQGGFAWLPVVIVMALVGLMIPTVKYITDPNVSFNILKLAELNCRNLKKKDVCDRATSCEWIQGSPKKCKFDSNGKCPNGCKYTQERKVSKSCVGLSAASCQAKRDSGCSLNKKKTEKVCKAWANRYVYKTCTKQDCKAGKRGCEPVEAHCTCPHFRDSSTCQSNNCTWIYASCSGKYRVTEKYCAEWKTTTTEAHCSGEYNRVIKAKCGGTYEAGHCEAATEDKQEEDETKEEGEEGEEGEKGEKADEGYCLYQGEEVNIGTVVYWQDNKHKICAKKGWQDTNKEITEGYVPSFLKGIGSRSCKMISGLYVGHGETVYGNNKKVFRCVDSKWKACPGCSVSYKPYYETQGNPEEQSCVMAGVVYLPGDEVKTALGTFKCVSGKMEEIDEEKIS